MGLGLLWAALGLKVVRPHWIADADDRLLGSLGQPFVPASAWVWPP